MIISPLEEKNEVAICPRQKVPAVTFGRRIRAVELLTGAVFILKLHRLGIPRISGSLKIVEVEQTGKLAYNKTMAKLEEAITSVNEDKRFVGTVALKNEEKTLPDGSTIALGIDGGHWVLVYQKKKGAQFSVYDYDSSRKILRADKKPGSEQDFEQMRKLIIYFFSNAREEDIVTILPPGGTHE